MKVHIIHENPDWMDPLRRALERAAVPFQEWFVRDGLFDFDAEPPQGVYLNRMSPSSHTRGHTASVSFTRELLLWLEGHGRRVINGSAAFALEVSKLRQYAALRQAGIETPRTVAVAGGPDRLREAAERMSGPFIVKHNRGGSGAAVRLFDDADDFLAYSTSDAYEPSADHVLLLQEYIESSEPCITRVEIVGDRFLYAMRSDTSSGFDLCPAPVCEDGPAGSCPMSGDRQSRFSWRRNFDDPIIDRYRAFMRRNQVAIAGIEFIEDHRGRKLTYDVNTTTNYAPRVIEESGIDGSEAIAALLKAELDAVRTRSRRPAPVRVKPGVFEWIRSRVASIP